MGADTLTTFTNYGLPGVVIGALFVSLWFLIKEIRYLSENANARIDKITLDHAQERECWNKSYQENTDVLRQIFNLQK